MSSAMPTLGAFSRFVASNWLVRASLVFFCRSCSYSRCTMPWLSSLTLAREPLSSLFWYLANGKSNAQHVGHASCLGEDCVCSCPHLP